MQRSNSPVSISVLSNPQDKELYNIKQKLEGTYWSNNNEGVFQFQFLSDSAPLTNLLTPHQFQLIRFTPDIVNYSAFQTVIPGRLNNDGTIEYGGGRIGILGEKGILWLDGSMWYPTKFVPSKNDNLLDLRKIQEQAFLDSATVMGSIYGKYLY